MNIAGSRILFLATLVLLLACARPEPKPEAPTPSPPPVATVPPAATATDTPTPTPPPVPTPDIPLEERLEGDDLAKYRSLPPEFRDALQKEAKETGHERAVQYLRELPDETVSIADLLAPSVLGFLPWDPCWPLRRPLNALELFHQLDGARQRALLLGGYADAVQHYADRLRRYADELGEELGEEHLDPKRHAVLFAQMVELAFDDGRMRLPPIEESLSAEALAKLETLDPLMQRVFRESWEQRKARAGETDR